MLALAALYFYATSQIRTFAFGDPVGPKTFPQLLCIGLVVVAIMLLFEMAAARRAAARPPQAGTADAAASKRHYLVLIAVMVLTGIYFAVFVPLGYVLATTIYLLALTSHFHRGKWALNSVTSVLYSVVSYLAFTRGLDVSLPAGVLPF
jgi:putative tricarboxylic transport membrane protein